MLKIAIIGDFCVFRIIDTLHLLYMAKQLKITEEFVDKCKTESSEPVIILQFTGERNETVKNLDFDILIIHNLKTKEQYDLVRNKNLTAAVTIINSDEKDICSAIKNKKTRIVNYGFNNKTCVTASSVSDGTLLFCIQRALFTFSGNVLEQQEFSVNYNDNDESTNCILAAVTAALIDDFSIDIIKNNLIKV